MPSPHGIFRFLNRGGADVNWNSPFCPSFVVVLYLYELHTMGNQPDLVSILISVTVSFCHFRYPDIYNRINRTYNFYTNFPKSHDAGSHILYHFRNLIFKSSVCLLMFLF